MLGSGCYGGWPALSHTRLFDPDVGKRALDLSLTRVGPHRSQAMALTALIFAFFSL